MLQNKSRRVGAHPKDRKGSVASRDVGERIGTHIWDDPDALHPKACGIERLDLKGSL